MTGTMNQMEQTMEELERRLTALEMRSTFQDELIEELNQVITACNLQVQKLVSENRNLREMMRSLAPDLPESPDE